MSPVNALCSLDLVLAPGEDQTEVSSHQSVRSRPADVGQPVLSAGVRAEPQQGAAGQVAHQPVHHGHQLQQHRRGETQQRRAFRSAGREETVRSVFI